MGGLQRADQLVPVVGRPPDAVAGHLVGVEARGPEIDRAAAASAPVRSRWWYHRRPAGEGEQAVFWLAPFGPSRSVEVQRDAGLGRPATHRTREVEVLDPRTKVMASPEALHPKQW